MLDWFRRKKKKVEKPPTATEQVSIETKKKVKPKIEEARVEEKVRRRKVKRRKKSA